MISKPTRRIPAAKCTRLASSISVCSAPCTRSREPSPTFDSTSGEYSRAHLLCTSGTATRGHTPQYNRGSFFIRHYILAPSSVPKVVVRASSLAQYQRRLYLAYKNTPSAGVFAISTDRIADRRWGRPRPPITCGIEPIASVGYILSLIFRHSLRYHIIWAASQTTVLYLLSWRTRCVPEIRMAGSANVREFLVRTSIH